MDRYDAILEEQGHKCAICKKPAGDEKRALHVDHCHSTAKVRGLLCASCNTALGHLKDRVDIIKSALKYLKKHGN